MIQLYKCNNIILQNLLIVSIENTYISVLYYYLGGGNMKIKELRNKIIEIVEECEDINLLKFIYYVACYELSDL